MTRQTSSTGAPGLVARALAAILLLAAVLAGALPVSGVSGPADRIMVVAGVPAPICHDGTPTPGVPSRGDRHRCCEACLVAGAVPPSATSPIQHPVPRAVSLVPLPAGDAARTRRLRTHRQAQAPPDAA